MAQSDSPGAALYRGRNLLFTLLPGCCVCVFVVVRIVSVRKWRSKRTGRKKSDKDDEVVQVSLLPKCKKPPI